MATNGFHLTTTPFTLLVFVVRKPGLTFEQFKEYYEGTHVPLVTRLLGGDQCFKSYSRHYIDRSSPMTFPFDADDSIPFDAVAVSEYANKAAYEATIGKFREYVNEIEADEENFLDRSKRVVVVSGVGSASKAVA